MGKVMQPHQAHDVGEVNGDALSAQEYQNLVERIYRGDKKLSRGVTALNDDNQVRDEVWRSYVNNKLVEKKSIGIDSLLLKFRIS